MKILLATVTALLFVAGCASKTATQRQPQQSTDIGNEAPDDRGAMFKLLKTHRTYFQIQLQSKTAEQFEVWYEQDGNGWDYFQMAVQADEKFNDIPEDRRLSDNQAIAGWPSPPKKLVRPPRELEGVAQRIKNAVPKTFPKEKIKQVLITYMGRAARVTTWQYIPRAPYDSKARFRPGGTSEKHYLMNLKTGKYKEFGGASSGGSALQEPYDTKKFPTSWVNVQLPYEAVGNPIIDLNFYDKPGETPSCLVAPLKAAHKQLMRAIANRARDMEAGTGLSSDQELAKLLASQGNDPIPLNKVQRLAIDMSIYGRANDFSDQIDSSIDVLAPISKLNQKINYKDPKTGVNLEFNLDLGNQKLSLMASHNGNSVQAQSSLEGYSIVSAGAQSFLQGYVDAPDRIELELPGAGTVTSYDIYLNRMNPSPFLLPAGVNCQ